MAPERTTSVLMFGGLISAAVVLAAVVAVGGAAWRAWLAAAVLCAAVPAGALVLSMMTRLIPGAWREGLAEPLAIAPGLLPLSALAMAPVLVAPQTLYGWTQHAGPGAFRAIYLTPAFFLARGLAWFALLTALAVRLRKGRASTAVVGLLIVVPIGLLISTDWLLSLDVDFASSGFGLYVLSIQVNLALALAVAFAVRTGVSDRTRDVLGGVLFVSVVLWAYLGFMPYFITWSGNLPPGVNWYRSREGGWAVLVWAAITLKGAPGAALIFGHVRRSAAALAPLALCIAAGAILEVAWLVLPALGPIAGPLDFVLFGGALLAFGAAGVGVCAFARVRREAAS
jgi:hypothetical protein